MANHEINLNIGVESEPVQYRFSSKDSLSEEELKAQNDAIKALIDREMSKKPQVIERRNEEKRIAKLFKPTE